MDPMHRRGNDDEPEPSFKHRRQSEVAMLKLSRSEERSLGYQKTDGRDAKCEHAHPLDSSRDQDLAQVEPNARGHIHIQITMVGPMEAPEERHAVIEPMGSIINEVEQDHGQDDMGDRLQ